MTTTITAWSESGGVGKTTTVFNLAAALSRQNVSVLICDFDPQPAGITDYAGHNSYKTDAETTLNDVLLNNDTPMSDIVIQGEDYDLIPAHEDLANLEQTIRSQNIPSAEFLLRRNLETVNDDYDVVLVDAPATLNLLVDNALIASEKVLIPMEMTRKGKKSIEGVMETVTGLEEQLQLAQPDFELDILGVLPNKVSDSTLNSQTKTNLEENGVPLLPVSIPDYNVLETSWGTQQDIFSYHENPEYGLRSYQESVLEAYKDLARHLIQNDIDGIRAPAEYEEEAEVVV